MADQKSKSQERREAAQADADASERDGLDTFYYPELGRSVRAENREAADKLIEKQLNEEATDKGAGEDKAE
jgi:hypothetical protein